MAGNRERDAALVKLGLSANESVPELLQKAFGFEVPTLPKNPRACSLTQEVFGTYLAGVISGMSRAKAARAAGITPSQLSSWRKRGKKDHEKGISTKQAVFYLASDHAEGLTEHYYHQIMIMAAPKDWRAAWNMLQGRYRVGDVSAEKDEDVKEGLRDEQLDRLRRALPKYATDDVIDAEEE